MDKKLVKTSLYTILNASAHARRVVDHSRRMAEDVDRKKRLEAQECQACFYLSKIGGCAMTNSPCGICETVIMYGSTNTHALCLQCAKANKLCVHCGGDIEMKARRKFNAVAS